MFLRSLRFTLVSFFLMFASYGACYAAPVLVQEASAEVQAPHAAVQAAQAPSQGDVELIRLYKTLQGIIESQAVDALPSDTEFRYAAAKGLFRALKDPYSDFFTPEETKYLQEQMQGSFAGIGATLKPEGIVGFTALTVVEIMADSPAQKADLRKGDQIYEIDGVAVSTYPFLVAIMHIRGDEGSTVELTVLREGVDKPMKIKVIREVITPVDTHVTSRLDGSVGIITLPQFGDAPVTAQEFYSHVDTLLAGGADAFIIDVRNNPGGLVDTAVIIASAWASAQTPVVTMERKSGNNSYGSLTNLALLAGKKTVVLVNGASASASEILAGALRDWGEATIVGTTTFGKGVAQSVIGLADGSSVHITSAYWLTPNGERIHKKGIEPDITVELTPEDAEAKRDPQMDRAMEFLKTGK
ncbi:MAG: S41 family peptidase [bacterium]|nr:S41 family peptidase [bacterium]